MTTGIVATDAVVGESAAREEPDGAPRIATLDSLRGIAILGILFMNINSMGGTMAASHGPRPDLIGWTPFDQLFWWLRQVFATGTARALLEMLFGAGMVILTGRLADRVGRWRMIGRYYWRNVVLFGFGMVHVFVLLWPGDVLHTYALAALIVFPLRRLPVWVLIVLGLSFATWSAARELPNMRTAVRENVLVASAKVHRAQGIAPTRDEKKAIAGLEMWHGFVAKTVRDNAAELRARSRGFDAWRGAMIGEYVRRASRPMTVMNVLWEAASVMLIGAALFRLGILQGLRSAAFYRRMAIGWYAIGLSIRVIAAWRTSRLDDSVTLLWACDEYGRIAMTLGHVGLVCWLLTTAAGRRLLKPFAAAGRTALTLYITQTLLCLWLLYPPFALGLFATQGWAGLMLTALAIDALLLWGANVYLRHYTIAPVEWLWRSLAEGRRVPFGGVAVEPRAG